ncbi:MAG: hypothetical protein EB114_13700 [Betaproteobacteria bacterium]|nr:hypothetical protein [Betaproteobacteria bacterium]
MELVLLLLLFQIVLIQPFQFHLRAKVFLTQPFQSLFHWHLLQMHYLLLLVVHLLKCDLQNQ